jgi:O-antigen ligase
MSKLIALKKEGGLFKFLENGIPVMLGLFIFIIPSPFNSSVREMSFYLLLIIAVSLIICKQTTFSFKSPFTVPFILFGLWVLICIPFALNKGNSLHDFYAHLLKHLIIFYLLINYFKSKRLFLVLSWIIVISITTFTIGGIVYFYFLKGMTLQQRFGLPEAGVDINHIGFLAVPVLFIAIALFSGSGVFKKTILSLSMISVILAVVLSGTKGALLGLVIPITFLITKYKKIIVIALLFLLLLIVITPFESKLHVQKLQDSVVAEVKIYRFSIWHDYLQIVKKYPAGGIGYGMQSYNRDFFNQNNFKLPDIANSKNNKSFFMPHNTLIDLAVRTGIIGVCLFLYCLCVLFRIGWLLYRDKKDVFVQNWSLCIMACCLSLIIQGMFVDLMIGLQLVYLFIFFAMINILWQMRLTDNNLHDS